MFPSPLSPLTINHKAMKEERNKIVSSPHNHRNNYGTAEEQLLAFCLSERCEERKAMLPVQSPAVSVS
jgi:hypothetical protein